MAEPLFSESWYRVADLRARLRGHATIVRHEYRGQPWYVIRDPASGRHHRISPAAHAIVARLDGRAPLDAVYRSALAEFGDDAPTQDGVIRLLGLLHAADLLICDVTPDGEELFRRFQRRESARWKRLLLNPLSMRFPLFDPEPFLARCVRWVRPWLSPWGALLWVAVVAHASLLAGEHWSELSHGVLDRVLSPSNLVLLWFCYPIMKAAHEFGHAFAARVWGGEVREMGIALLVFVPVPYVDASSASAFPERARRVVVGAAGMGVEMILASFALYVWVAVEPGLVRDIAYNAMLIGSVSTLLFNANPLLRFDGYYMLSDALGIPNLGKRANEHLRAWAQRRLFGVASARSPAQDRSERLWLALYGIAAGIYQWVVLFAILLLVGSRFFGLGLLFAAWILAMRVLSPLWRFAQFLRESPLLARTRRRAVGVSAGLAGALALALCWVPLPHFTRAEAVIWLPEDSHVRAASDGFVTRVLSPPDSWVREGEPLIETRDPLLDARVRVLEAGLREVRARYDAAWSEDPIEAELIREELRAAEAELARAREQEGERIIRSPGEGLFVLPERAPVDRFVRRGERLGYVTDLRAVTARAVVPQADVALVRDQTRAVEARLVSDIGRVLPARVARAVPGGTRSLPSAALGTAGGGRLEVSSEDREGLEVAENVFEFDVELPADAGVEHAGQRVYLRFDHGAEPLAFRAVRALRRLLLSRLGV